MMDLSDERAFTASIEIAWRKVLAERQRQHERFGWTNHQPTVWLMLLTEALGGLARAINEADPSWYATEALVWPRGAASLLEIETEAVQVAALAVAMVEHITRLRTEAGR